MAPNSHVVVTLKLPTEQLKKFDFSDLKAPTLKKKPRKRPTKKTDTSEDALDDDTKPSSAPPSTSTVNTSSGVDPILGSLPRSLKAAPVANTAGLVLDKTPCRKWRPQKLELRTLSGYTVGLQAWTSDYTDKEWEEKLKRDAVEEEAAAASGTPERAETPDATRATPVKIRKITLKTGSPLKKPNPKIKEEPDSSSKSKPKPKPALKPSEEGEGSTGHSSTEASIEPSVEPMAKSAEPSSDPPSEMGSEPASDLVSEPASEAPSEAV